LNQAYEGAALGLAKRGADHPALVSQDGGSGFCGEGLGAKPRAVSGCPLATAAAWGARVG
jgi:hypothetical protein